MARQLRPGEHGTTRRRAAAGGLVVAATLGVLATVPAAPAAADTPSAAVPQNLVTGDRASTVTALPWPLLRTGSHGQPVRSLQYLLRAHGRLIAVDGAFGPQTSAAVRAFQAGSGLVADGVVGPLTWGRLIVPVQQGSRGDAVRAVQDQFQFRNLSGDPTKGLRVDGIFGPKTAAAVRGFQQAVGLAPDGVVGPLTWNQLIGGALSF